MQEQELKQLLQELSLDEKIGQLLQLDGNLICDDISLETGPTSFLGFRSKNKQLCGSVINLHGAKRVKEIQKAYIKNHPHHIPMLFMLDVINGYRTVFPIPLAQGCTFSPTTVQLATSITAAETSTDGVHVTFSPMSDLVNDSRWGRVMESTGEDPYLNSLMSTAMIKGYQGEHLEQRKLAACMKHFAAYGSPLGGREYNTVELSERSLFEDYMPAYQAAIDAGCKLVMTSFNTLDRIPCTANQHLLQNILREQFSFDGVIISDYGSVAELIPHTIAADRKEAASLAFSAGVDIEMCSTCYVENLQSLIEDPTQTSITEEKLNEAVLRILTLKNELGLFENPYKDADEILHDHITLCKEHREAAFHACVQSFVLLKNEANTLPLSTKNSIAFIGPYADNKAIHGAWSHQAAESDTITLKEGVLKYHPSAFFAKGCSLLKEGAEIYGFGIGIYNSDYIPGQTEQDCERAIELAKQVETVVLCLGEHRLQSGEGGSSVNSTIPAHQLEFLKKVHSVNPNIVLVLFSGRPLILTEIEPLCKSILCVWFPGTEGGNAIASVLYGESEPRGRLAITFPRHVGQLPMSYRELSTGRPLLDPSIKSRFISRYQDCLNTPLYPFGFGLGYTNFTLSSVTLDKTVLKKEESLQASVTVTNIGQISGKQIVQLYLADPAASVCRPVRELKGFKEIELEPNHSETVSFTITEPMLRFYGIDMKYQSEPGDIKVYIGFDSTTENVATFRYE